MVSLRNGKHAKAATTTSPERNRASAKRKSQETTSGHKDEEVKQDTPQGKKAKTTKSAAPSATEENKENEHPETSRPQTQKNGTSENSKTSRLHTPPPASHLTTATPPPPAASAPSKEKTSNSPRTSNPSKEKKATKSAKQQWEKEQEYTQFIRENEAHTFHELYVCYDKGPNGSPTYDKAGFELDYGKVADWMKPVSVRSLKPSKKQEKYFDTKREERKRKREIFFAEGEAPGEENVSPMVEKAWTDRVSKDLGVPFHRVGVEEFVEWEKRGFPKARRGEYGTLTKGESDRLSGLSCGSALRK